MIAQEVHLFFYHFFNDCLYLSDGVTLIELHDLQPGSAISFLFKLPEKQDKACRRLRETIQTKGPTELPQICSKLNFDDLNRVLFRCDQEEREDGKGRE